LFLVLGEWAGAEPKALVTESLSMVIRREDFRIRESIYNKPLVKRRLSSDEPNNFSQP